MLENDIQVRTPEQVRLKLHLAGIGSRAVAQLLDLLILAVVYILFTISQFLWQWLDVFGRATSYLVGASAVISFLIFWGYFIALETALSGQTIGKRVMKIRTVQRDGRPITFYSATIRNLLRIIDFLPLGYLFGLIVALIDKQERRIGDFAAGTVVVRDRMTSLWQYSGYAGWMPTDESPQTGAPTQPGSSTTMNGSPTRNQTSTQTSGSLQTSGRESSEEHQTSVQRVIELPKLGVSVVLTGDLPLEWTQFLIQLGPRIKGVGKSRRAQLLPDIWKSFIALDQVQMNLADRPVTQGDMERILVVVSKEIRGRRRGRKAR